MRKPIVISLCDRTGNFLMPWAEAGYDCYAVDVQHSIRRPRVERVGGGTITYQWGDARSWRRPSLAPVAFFAAWPPCTDVCGSGARDHVTKGLALLTDAVNLFNACEHAASWSGAPYLIENPVGVLSTHIRKPDHYFQPWEYAGYRDDIETDNTTKKTCLWTGNGFVMPERKPAPAPHRNDCWLQSPGDDRGDLRAVTPMGFARAVFEANAQVEVPS